MDAYLTVALIIALLCVSAVCVVLIMLLLRAREVLNGFEKDMKDVTARAIPVLENMDYITNRVKSITDNIDDQVMMVHESIGSIRQIADNVVSLERKVQERVEGPILDSVAFVAALLKGVRTFVERVRA